MLISGQNISFPTIKSKHCSNWPILQLEPINSLSVSCVRFGSKYFGFTKLLPRTKLEKSKKLKQNSNTCPGFIHNIFKNFCHVLSNFYWRGEKIGNGHGVEISRRIFPVDNSISSLLPMNTKKYTPTVKQCYEYWQC